MPRSNPPRGCHGSNRSPGYRYDPKIVKAFETRNTPIHYMIQDQAGKIRVGKCSNISAAICAVINVYPNLLRIM
jgi:hypothetical protein